MGVEFTMIFLPENITKSLECNKLFGIQFKSRQLFDHRDLLALFSVEIHHSLLVSSSIILQMKCASLKTNKVNKVKLNL
jgi:hypothetical protein